MRDWNIFRSFRVGRKTAVSLKADYYIFGLGNMGEKYQGTRHNAGFDVVDTIANEYNAKFDIAKNRALCAKINVRGKDILLVKPQTYMNNSGLCVKDFLKKTKVDIDDIVVIYDDIDINKSAIRIKNNGSAGSHNGIRSIIYHIQKDNFKRIRIGIGRPKDMNDLIPFVIGKFDGNDYNIMYDCYKKVAKAAVEIFFDGISAVQGRYNYKGVS